MYKLVFGKGHHLSKHTVLTQGSLEHCSASRAMSGDLVLDPNGDIDKSTTWLFTWEKNDPNCYARRAQSRGWRN